MRPKAIKSFPFHLKYVLREKKKTFKSTRFRPQHENYSTSSRLFHLTAVSE